MNINTIGIVGGGIMGNGIARACALGGAQVIVCELDADAASRAQRRVEESLERAVRSAKIDEVTRAGIASRLTFTESLEDLASCDLVIEAIVEDEAAKTELFAALDKVLVRPQAVLATNTSSIPVTRLAAATTQPGRVLGLHFFNPVPARQLVELITTLRTDPGLADGVERFVVDRLKKHVVRSGDRAGFVVNALLTPYLLSAIRMLESGVASAAQIDLGMTEGCAHPVGPLALADFVGLDTLVAASTSMYQEFKDSVFAPPPLLLRMVDAGLHGRKTGRGFFEYAP